MKRYIFDGVDNLLDYPDGIVNIRRSIINPLITCEQCSKWKQLACPRTLPIGKWDRGSDKPFEPHFTYTDPDDTCKDATPKDNQS